MINKQPKKKNRDSVNNYRTSDKQKLGTFKALLSRYTQEEGNEERAYEKFVELCYIDSDRFTYKNKQRILTFDDLDRFLRLAEDELEYKPVLVKLCTAIINHYEKWLEQGLSAKTLKERIDIFSCFLLLYVFQKNASLFVTN